MFYSSNGNFIKKRIIEALDEPAGVAEFQEYALQTVVDEEKKCSTSTSPPGKCQKCGGGHRVNGICKDCCSSKNMCGPTKKHTNTYDFCGGKGDTLCRGCQGLVIAKEINEVAQTHMTLDECYNNMLALQTKAKVDINKEKKICPPHCQNSKGGMRQCFGKNCVCQYCLSRQKYCGITTDYCNRKGKECSACQNLVSAYAKLKAYDATVKKIEEIKADAPESVTPTTPETTTGVTLETSTAILWIICTFLRISLSDPR